MTERQISYPKKNWGKEAIGNFIADHNLDINIEEFDLDEPKAKETLLDLIKDTLSSRIEEEAEKEPSVTIDLAHKVPKLYSVRLYSKHSCVIGGTRYNFLPNIEYKVPANVRQVLLSSSLVLR